MSYKANYKPFELFLEGRWNKTISGQKEGAMRQIYAAVYLYMYRAKKPKPRTISVSNTKTHHGGESLPFKFLFLPEDLYFMLEPESSLLLKA